MLILQLNNNKNLALQKFYDMIHQHLQYFLKMMSHDLKNLILYFHRKVAFIYRVRSIIICHYEPFVLHDMNPVRIILCAVKVFINHIPAVYGNAVFAGIPTHGDGYFFLHFKYSGTIIVNKNMTNQVRHQNSLLFISLPIIKYL